MKQINLLPKDEQRQLHYDLLAKQVSGFITVVMIMFGVFLGAVFGLQQYIKQVSARTIQTIQEKQVILDNSDNQELRRDVLDLNQSIKEIGSIRNQQYAFSYALKELSQIVPPDVQLNSLVIEREKGTVNITGQARTRDNVIELWSAIKKSQLFSGVDFPLTNLEKPESSNFRFSFTIKLEQLKHEDAANN